MRTVAIVGAGVIGSGWVVRFLLNGWNVRVFDLNSETRAVVNETLARARRHVTTLQESTPTEGELTFSNDLTDAVSDVAWVQESLPEDLALKSRVLAELDELVPQDIPICSSTSGFKPTVLGKDITGANRLAVCHPFNPVYLLPLVEVVPHVSVAEETLASIVAILTDLQMRPLHVRQEIDGHIADRLLEAMWREALWLVHDDVATTEEIDAAIKYGFGLRAAQMGLFETYQLGGGEAGMRHFLAQFGPALQWPWTKLMDVPTLDGELIDKIASQVEAQSEGKAVSKMLEDRDRNLVATMRALSGKQ